jgi:response regulator RpfG family c-di-GMP phosphodiesterase
MYQPAADTASPAAQAKPTLLLLDDEERVLRALSIVFRPHYRVLTTTDGAEAVDIVRRERVHVLVSDQRMPRMSGVEVLRQVKEVSPQTMRLLLTGYADMQAVMDSVNEGEVFRYITKPWNVQSLKSTVAQAAGIAASLEGFYHSGAHKALPDNPCASGAGVLVLDDAGETLNTVQTVVEDRFSAACRIHGADSLDVAGEILARGGVSVVVSEMRVGGEDISEVITTLKQIQPEVPVVVVTSVRDSSAIVRLINEGQIFRYLPKPLSRNLFETSLKSALRHASLIRSAPQLAARHAVELPPAPAAAPEPVVAAPAAMAAGAPRQRLLGFLSRLRGRNASRPTAV